MPDEKKTKPPTAMKQRLFGPPVPVTPEEEKREFVAVLFNTSKSVGFRASSIDGYRRTGSWPVSIFGNAPDAPDANQQELGEEEPDFGPEMANRNEDQGPELVARANHQRIFDDAEEAQPEGEQLEANHWALNEQRPRNLTADGEPVVNEDGSFTLRGYEVLNNCQQFLRNLQLGENRVPRLYYGDEATDDLEQVPECSTAASTPRRLIPGTFPANTSHVLAIEHRPANAVETNMLGWQAEKGSLKERLSFMYCNDILADVYFIVGQGDNHQRIPAHRFVLSIGSVVFDAMFNGRLTPKNSGQGPQEIELPDIEPCSFMALLRFLYTDEVSIGPDSVMTTLYTAKKYAVRALENACIDFLKESLAPDNAFMLLTQARLFDEPQLAELCLETIDKDTVPALDAESFVEIDHDTLCLVLGRDSLRVREAQLFQAIIAWATEECGRRGIPQTSENKRAVLGRALPLIRFPLMTIEEFAQTAAQSGLLSDRQMVELFLYYTVNPKPATHFIERPRSVMVGKEFVVTRFNVSKAATIQIHHCGTGKLLAHNDTTFQCDGSQNTFRVSFLKPVEIIPSITYTASACLKGPDSFYGSKGLRRIVLQPSSQTNNVTFQFTYAAGNNNGTSVEDGQIPEIYFYRRTL
ncbi:unnamed protein product, partial [Mesorhabditis spiculigera]